MDKRKMFLLALMVLPWLSLPFLGKKAIKRFSITGLFIGLLFALESVVAFNRGWWRVHTRLVPKLIAEFPFIAGPFYIGALWILKLTYGKFIRYLLVNLGVDSFHIFLFVAWLKKLGIASLVRLKNYQALLLFTANALVMYGFQSLIDKKVNPVKPKSWFKKILSFDF